MRIIVFAAFLVASAYLLLSSGLLRPFGSPESWEMDRYFLENSQKEAAANNVVTAVLFDYRGFDTLGEATVLFTAVVGVAALLRKRKKGE